MIILLALAAAGLAYFLVNWAFLSNKRRSLTRIERANAEIVERQRREQRLSTRQRAIVWLNKNGWRGELAPIVAGATFLYATIVVILRGLGVGEIIGAVAGIPVSFAVVGMIAKRLAERRQVAFKRQLMNALGQMISLIESGSGAEKALREMVPSLPDPLGEELASALDRTIASKDLIASLKSLEEAYPSRAFSLFIAALEVDKERGGSLGPALRQAQAMLSKDFELAEEALAEISQTRSEFYVIVSIIGGVVLTMFTTSDETIRDAYMSPTGLIAIGLFGANFLLGIVRVLKVFNRAKGGVR